MILVGQSGEYFVFELLKRQRDLFFAILKLYPVLNPDYHEVSRSNRKDNRVQESQRLLHEAMAEQREANRKRVVDFLKDEKWEKIDSRYHMKVTSDEIEWLLQVLNDIRVGSWVILGKPDPESGERPKLTLEQMPYAGALELSGYFQMALLEAREI